MKIRLLLLALIIPFISIAQEVTQQVKTPSSGATAGNQYFGYWGIKTNGYLIIPTWTNATANRQTPLNGQFGFQLSDSTGRVYYNGSWLPLGGGGSSNSIYFSNRFFNGAGTSVSPLTVRYRNGLQSSTTGIGLGGILDTITYFQNNGNIAKWDSLQVLNAPVNPFGVLRRADTNIYVRNLDGVVNGLGLSIVSTDVVVAAGSWRINNMLYSKGTTTTLPIDAQDPTLSRYDIVVANTSNTQQVVSGTLSSSPVYPAVPANTILVGAVLITPTSVTTIQPVITNYVTTTTNQNVAGVKTLMDTLKIAPGKRIQFQPVSAGTPMVIEDNTITAGNTGNLNFYSPVNAIYGQANYYQFTDLSSSNLLFLGNGSSAVTSFMPHLRVLNAPIDSTDVVRKMDLTGLGIGTVTSVATGAGLTGGTITTIGTISADTTVLRTVANSYSLAGMQTKLNGYVPSTRTLTGGTGVLTIGDLSSNRTISADTTALQTVANFFPKGDTRYLKSSTASSTYAPIASPTFTGTVTFPSPFTLGSTSVTSTGTQLNYLSGATGTTGTGSVVLNSGATLIGTTSISSLSVTGMSGFGVGPSATAYGRFQSSTTGIAQARYLTGVDPSTPVSGDFWRTSGSTLKFYDGSATDIFGFVNVAQNWSAVQTFNKTVNTTPDDEVIVGTTAAAANGAQQYSPGINLQGNGWGTTAGTSQPVNFRMYTIPVQGTTPAANLMIDFSVNGGAYGNRFQLGSNGAWSFNGGAGAGLGGSYTATVANIATTSTDGIFIKNTQPATVGTPVQYSPRLRFTGTVWNTTATAATNQIDWKMETRGVSGTTPTSALWFSSSLVTGSTPSFTDRMSISDVGLLSVAHITSTTSAPTISAGTGAGTSPTVTVSGTDLGHQVNVTTGTSPATSATVATVTFNVAYGAAPKVIQLTPANSVTAALNGTAQIYVDAASTTTTVYVIKVGSGGLAASTAYSWYATVIQ